MLAKIQFLQRAVNLVVDSRLLELVSEPKQNRIDSVPDRTRTIPYHGQSKVESGVIWLSTGTVEYDTGTSIVRNWYGSFLKIHLIELGLYYYWLT